jgi:IS5 family transposase
MTLYTPEFLAFIEPNGQESIMGMKRLKMQNWTQYNKALVNRGSITLWFDKESIESWYQMDNLVKRGRPYLYSDLAIECCLTLRAIFKMPLRATQGFVTSLLQIMQLPLTAPDYSLLCKRQKTLKIKLPKRKSNQGMHLVADSTGLKVYGEGEWKVRQHGKSKRRTWVKLHLSINEATHDIEAVVLTADNVHDCEVLPEMLKKIDQPIDQVTGDGAYDTHDNYAAVVEKNATPCFPPRKNAVWHKAIDEAWRLRNHAISQVRYRGSKKWKKKTNYHRRSMAETAMYRFKQLFGGHVASRHMKNQTQEVAIKCRIINGFNSLGMPVY